MSLLHIAASAPSEYAIKLYRDEYPNASITSLGIFRYPCLFLAHHVNVAQLRECIYIDLSSDSPYQSSPSSLGLFNHLIEFLGANHNTAFTLDSYLSLVSRLLGLETLDIVDIHPLNAYILPYLINSPGNPSISYSLLPFDIFELLRSCHYPRSLFQQSNAYISEITFALRIAIPKFSPFGSIVHPLQRFPLFPSSKSRIPSLQCFISSKTLLFALLSLFLRRHHSFSLHVAKNLAYAQAGFLRTKHYSPRVTFSFLATTLLSRLLILITSNILPVYSFLRKTACLNVSYLSKGISFLKSTILRHRGGLPGFVGQALKGCISVYCSHLLIHMLIHACSSTLIMVP